MTETKQFHSDKCKGYFGTKRDALLVTVNVNSNNTYYGEQRQLLMEMGVIQGKRNFWQ